MQIVENLARVGSFIASAPYLMLLSFALQFPESRDEFPAAASRQMHARSCERCRVDCSFCRPRSCFPSFIARQFVEIPDFVDTFRKVVAFAWVVSLVWLAVLGVSQAQRPVSSGASGRN
jgi:hypothetical protein